MAEIMKSGLREPLTRACSTVEQMLTSASGYVRHFLLAEENSHWIARVW